MKPLNGVKVIDLTHMLAGPYAGMVLADLGAEVVKVEPLGSGEMTRGLLKNDPDYSFKNFGAYFLTLNRNKKSVSIDLKNKKLLFWGRQTGFSALDHGFLHCFSFSISW